MSLREIGTEVEVQQRCTIAAHCPDLGIHPAVAGIRPVVLAAVRSSATPAVSAPVPVQRPQSPGVSEAEAEVYSDAVLAHTLLASLHRSPDCGLLVADGPAAPSSPVAVSDSIAVVDQPLNSEPAVPIVDSSRPRVDSLDLLFQPSDGCMKSGDVGRIPPP